MASLDVSDAFDSSFLDTVWVKQSKLGVGPDGKWEEQGFSVVAIPAVVLPLSREPTATDPNAYIVDSIEVYSKSPLLTSEATYVLHNNAEYRVDSVADYTNVVAGFKRAVCRLVNQ